MVWGILADVVLTLHALFIAWVVLGAVAVALRPWLLWLHLPALAWGLFVQFTGTVCPLTPIEVALRHAAGEQGYAGGFVEHYLGAIVYPEGLTREAQWRLGGLLAAFNLGLYAWVWWRRARPQPMR
jgi:uncharacterized membrane protein YvlD (DUF360 family)